MYSFYLNVEIKEQSVNKSKWNVDLVNWKRKYNPVSD